MKALTEATSVRMSQTKQRDTSAEMKLRRILHAKGLRYRVDKSVLNHPRRRADLVFRKARVAVFVDGCFWHGCPEHGTWPKHNATFWADKIRTNRSRDADTNDRLTAEGWAVVRVWEHEDPENAASQIEQIVRKRIDHQSR